MTNLRLYFSEDISAKDSTNSNYNICDLPLSLMEQGVAYHRISGFIGYDIEYRNSLAVLENNIKEAELNTNTFLHFFHINSHGGEAYYNDRIAALIRSLNKPTYCLIEKNCCSAGYYIASQCDKIVASTTYDIIGSIGTMTVVYDDRQYLSNLGFKEIIIKSSKSDLKNKLHDDILDGNTQEYISRFVDPLQQQFEKDVRCRKKLSKLPVDHEIFRGQIYYAFEALNLGLIDSIAINKESVMAEVLDLVKKSKLHTKILNFI